MPKPIFIALLMFTVIVSKTPAALIQFDSFSDLSPLVLNGSSKINDAMLRLNDAANQNGSAFYPKPVAIDPAHGFSSWFQFQISADSDGGDVSGGLAFVLQSRGPQALGGGGGGLGYAGISPSLAIEFDTFRNAWDPSDNHIGVNLNGSVASQATYYFPTSFDNGRVWNAWIDHDPAADLLGISISADANKPDFSMFTYRMNYYDVFDPADGIFVGFTAATGSNGVNHEILSWRLDCPPNPVPLPGTLVLFLPAAVLTIFRSRLSIGHEMG